MISTMIQAVAVASVGLLSPGSMTIVLLLLMSGKGIRNGFAYALGYISMYSVIGVGVLLIGVNSAEFTPSEQKSIVVPICMLALGIFLLSVTYRNWRTPRAASDKPSRFTRLTDSMTPLKAFGFGATITFINVKNLAIFLSAVSVLLLSDLLLITQLTLLAPVVLVFCTSIMAPVAIAMFMPNRADRYLGRIKQTLDDYSHPIGLILLLIIGTLLLYRGVLGLI